MRDATFLDLVPASAFWTPEDFRASSWLGHVPFAFWIVDALRPRALVELGTWHGMSYLAFCQAIAALDLETRALAVDTWAGDHQAGLIETEALASLRQVHDPKYRHFSTLVQSTFDDALATVPDGSVDLLHIDGLHTYAAVRHDFETWLPKLSDRAVVLFHDTQERHDDFGVYEFWAEVAARYPHFEFAHEHGLGVLGVGPDLPAEVRSLFAATSDGRQDKVRAVFEQLGEGVRRRYSEAELRAQLRHVRGRWPMRAGRALRDLLTRQKSLPV